MHPELRKRYPVIDTEDKLKVFLDIAYSYSCKPSLTGTVQESEFLSFLKEDFDVYANYEVKESYRNNRLEYVFCKSRKFTYPYFFTVHVDRVGDKKGKAYDTPIELLAGEGITGQLDNVISVAVLKYLHKKGFSFNFLLTTKEEIFQSAPQVIEIARAEELIPISLDIDIFESRNEFEGGQITLRDNDINASMHQPTVQMLRKIADAIKVPYFVDEGYTSVESGFVSKRTNGEVKGAHIGIPIINYHSDEEATNHKCVLNMIKLLERVLS